MSEYILEMKNISKRFGGIHALNDVNLQLRSLQGSSSLQKVRFTLMASQCVSENL